MPESSGAVARAPESVPGVCDVDVVRAAGSDPQARPSVLVEVPHGATRERHFDAARRRLHGDLDGELKAFFFVNTDVGAPECAAAFARLTTSPDGELAAWLADDGRSPVTPIDAVLIVRGLIPRTFIDCNRALELGADQDLTVGLTPAVPEYVQDPRDAATLEELYRTYQSVTRRAYDLVCGGGGTALILHTYAPKSIRIDRVDRDIVRQLRAAYEPGPYARWESRPDVDLISEGVDGERLAHAGLLDAVKTYYPRVGVTPTENVSYRLHPATMGHLHSLLFPGRVLCVEINRERLADPFIPFAEMHVPEANATRMARPLAAAWLREQDGRAGGAGQSPGSDTSTRSGA